uniref:Uncharacterized mitochondrial protein AtMg00810-like n=1 Tax=Nicotiana tabacum TaxID=4097 RepID=A0A1S3YTS0_TOBAC|nr:PREDICTED: uncharacterized mitochondrial protein AtMg00810-like [Nicotiana tabacum]
MTQPAGFVDPKFPNHVCKLHKALYGLKEAPRAWFEKLSTALLELGFLGSKSDSPLFIRKRSDHITFILVYVNELIVTGSSSSFILDLIRKLSNAFALKDLGNLHYFLGIEVSHARDGLILCQSKYIRDLLARAKMEGAKPIATPMLAGQQLSQHGNTTFHDHSLYRSLVGALQYITITRPDVSYTVNKLCQFMHNPMESHFQAMKILLRYLKGTIHLGLLLRPSSQLHINGFSDADWAGSPDDRRSTHGYCIYLGKNMVSWSSKKQKVVACSSTKAEYRALAAATAETTWLQHLLQELGVILPQLQSYGVITSPLPTLLPIQFFMLAQNILNWIFILFEKK